MSIVIFIIDLIDRNVLVEIGYASKKLVNKTKTYCKKIKKINSYFLFYLRIKM